MSLAPGARLGPYEIVSQIGAGGMGEVYRARDSRLGRDVAIKVLATEYAADPERLRRFEQEARAASSLNHPNILSIFDIGTHQGSPFLVMELLAGESLAELLKSGPPPASTALDFALQIARGLAAAHERGIVHRDLKPGNLFVTADGRVKILDFGLAKHLPADGAAALTEAPTQDGGDATKAGILLGTVGYMSPEQARGERADDRSDIFSFGCVLYEMLAGRPPFQKDSAVETLSAILKDEPPPLAAASGDISPALRIVMTRCLEKRREKRFASAQELAAAVGACAQAPAAYAANERQEKSIVVLPFENLSPDPDNAYFADGLTEEIIADLSKVRSLLVISRTSAMCYKGATKSLPAIADELNVRYVLEGSVRRAGNNLRITAQLIEAATDGHLWAEKYTGAVDDVFDMQEKVSRAIVEALKVELTPEEARRLADRPIQSAYAFECYLKARREIWRWVGPSLDRAAEYLEQGLRALPDNPLLLAGMAYVHFQRLNMGLGQKDSLRNAEAFATRALELSPNLVQAHVVLGLIAAWRPGMIKTAIAHFEQALSGDPNDQDALKWAGVIYSFVGRVAEAAAMGETVIAMDPMAPMSYMPVVFSRWLEGRFDAALEFLDRACQVAPSDTSLRVSRVCLLIPMGLHEEAFALAAQAEKDEQPAIFHWLARLWRCAIVGNRETALSWMTPEAIETCRRDMQYSWWVACGYVMLGDHDSAFDWLENAVDHGFLNHRYLGEIDPILAPLRGDPRFQELMARAKKLRAELEA